eukprot:GHVO01043756.1.p1 GENE.GHVO01043756.1~~GHVO01043756.1.p1  ORF type:complete len:338 (+),score=43.59 GHVO01043756.1:58-1071(+)
MDSLAFGPQFDESRIYKSRAILVNTLRIFIVVQFFLTFLIVFTPYYHELVVSLTFPLVGLYGVYGGPHSFKLFFVSVVNVPTIFAETSKAITVLRGFSGNYEANNFHIYDQPVDAYEIEETNTTLSGLPLRMEVPIRPPKRLQRYRSRDPREFESTTTRGQLKFMPRPLIIKINIHSANSTTLSRSALADFLQAPVRITSIPETKVFESVLYTSKAFVALIITCISFKLLSVSFKEGTDMWGGTYGDEEEEQSSLIVAAHHPAVAEALRLTKMDEEGSSALPDEGMERMEHFVIHAGNISTFARNIGAAVPLRHPNAPGQRNLYEGIRGRPIIDDDM